MSSEEKKSETIDKPSKESEKENEIEEISSPGGTTPENGTRTLSGSGYTPGDSSDVPSYSNEREPLWKHV